MNRILSDPQRLFRLVAIAEAVTWALLLTGMVLKYVTDDTELGRADLRHGPRRRVHRLLPDDGPGRRRPALVASAGRCSGLAASIPPFFTVLFDRYAEKRGALAGSWRLTRHEPPASRLDRPVSWLLRNPVRGRSPGWSPSPR